MSITLLNESICIFFFLYSGQEFEMNRCEFTENCPVFNERLGALPGLVNILKQQYCLLLKNRCARYRIVQALGREYVPYDLLPNDAERADLIIAESEHIKQNKAV
jgi:hypothetical protein